MDDIYGKLHEPKPEHEEAGGPPNAVSMELPSQVMNL